LEFDLIGLAIAFLIAVVGGMINGIAGGGTVLVFPMLVWLGLDPVEANITNAVSLWTASLGGALGFGRALRGTDRFWYWMAIPAAIGGVAGALLLVALPADIFASTAPYFVLASAIIMLLQPTLRRRVERYTGSLRNGIGTRVVSVTGLLLISIYGGYFGAGLGIFMLVALSLLGVEDLLQANGLKNIFGFLIKGVAVLSFVVTGNVIWTIALVLMVGSILGAYVAARVGSRVGPRPMRIAIIIIGFLMAALMFAGIAD